MTKLVSINCEREKRASGDQKKIIEGLRELLARAERGELKSICYAAVDTDERSVTLGALQSGAGNIAELVGLSHMLCDSLLNASRD